MSRTKSSSSNITLAELHERDKISTAKSSARSVASVSCETGCVFDARSDHDQDITIPSLTMNKTLPEESEASLDAEVPRTKTWLENLEKLRSCERHLTDDSDKHEDWKVFVELQGQPIDVQNEARILKMFSKVEEVVPSSITSETGMNLEKGRQHQNISPPPRGVQIPSAPPSPATKRVCRDESTLDPIILSRINHEAGHFSQPDISLGWDHEFNYEMYEATNQDFSSSWAARIWLGLPNGSGFISYITLPGKGEAWTFGINFDPRNPFVSADQSHHCLVVKNHDI